jgi:hypothetical protein
LAETWVAEVCLVEMLQVRQAVEALPVELIPAKFQFLQI